MATLEVVNIQNKKAGSVDLAPAVFESAIRPHLYHAEVRRQLADRRAGTHSTKNRAGVSGGGIKPYKQKGTGRARQGTIRAPQYAGGGVVFGPVPRGYSHKLPKKVRRAALASALTQRVQESAVTVVDVLAMDGYSTKRMREVLKSLGLEDRSTLIVIYALCGFANLASIGLLVSTLTTLAPARRTEILSLGVKSWIAGNLVTCMVGAVIGVVTPS